MWAEFPPTLKGWEATHPLTKPKKYGNPEKNKSYPKKLNGFL